MAGRGRTNISVPQTLCKGIITVYVAICFNAQRVGTMRDIRLPPRSGCGCLAILRSV